MLNNGCIFSSLQICRLVGNNYILFSCQFWCSIIISYWVAQEEKMFSMILQMTCWIWAWADTHSILKFLTSGQHKLSCFNKIMKNHSFKCLCLSKKKPANYGLYRWDLIHLLLFSLMLALLPTDASGDGIGVVLNIVRDNRELQASSYSRQLQGAYTNYGVKEGTGNISYHIPNWIFYLFKVFTDHKPHVQ